MVDIKYTKNRFVSNPLLALINNHLIDYPTPTNLNYFYGFGSLAGIMLVIQIVTGILLAMHYTPHVAHAFSSVEHIMRDVEYGWLLRYAHANGASFFFMIVYIHMFRGLYYGSYNAPRQMLWCSGVILFLLMMATGFMGYILPWGQMSFWGATVITNLFSAIPLIGQDIVLWLWGGFAIDNPTLNRFFSLHFFLPFIIAALSFFHLILLHQEGSTNPLGHSASTDYLPFYPYFYVKDLLGVIGLMVVFIFVICFKPNALGHPDNYLMADAISTPAHIVPEWYFLPFYAILRSIPDKVGGIVAMLVSILILLVLPFITTSEIRTATFRPVYKCLYWMLFSDFIILGWVGQQGVEDYIIQIGQIATTFYFVFFAFLVPITGTVEKILADSASEKEAELGIMNFVIKYVNVFFFVAAFLMLVLY